MVTFKNWNDRPISKMRDEQCVKLILFPSIVGNTFIYRELVDEIKQTRIPGMNRNIQGEVEGDFYFNDLLIIGIEECGSHVTEVDNWTIQEKAEQIAGKIIKEVDGPCIFAGYSYGGRVALETTAVMQKKLIDENITARPITLLLLDSSSPELFKKLHSKERGEQLLKIINAIFSPYLKGKLIQLPEDINYELEHFDKQLEILLRKVDDTFKENSTQLSQTELKPLIELMKKNFFANIKRLYKYMPEKKGDFKLKDIFVISTSDTVNQFSASRMNILPISPFFGEYEETIVESSHFELLNSDKGKSAVINKIQEIFNQLEFAAQVRLRLAEVCELYHQAQFGCMSDFIIEALQAMKNTGDSLLNRASKVYENKNKEITVDYDQFGLLKSQSLEDKNIEEAGFHYQLC